MKYTLEFKLECVDKYKNGEYIPTSGESKNQRDAFMSQVRNWAKAYEDLGIDGLRHSGTNKEWTAQGRLGLVAKILSGRSVKDAAREAHISSGQLSQWVRRYREKGMDGLECRRGRTKKVPIMPKKKELTPSEREELEILRASSGPSSN